MSNDKLKLNFIVFAFACLIIFFGVSPNTLAAGPAKKKAAGPGWHLKGERTDWPEHLKSKRPSGKEDKDSVKSKKPSKGPMVLKVKRRDSQQKSSDPAVPQGPEKKK